MNRDASIPLVREIMTQFARLTGLSPAASSPTRYLWTDAFAVCNFLGLYQETGEEVFRNLALQLVDQVHNVLGRHRSDDQRTGWISGYDEELRRLHPTEGGLRIGKKLQERRPEDPPDERLEWDQDGQYYHYLAKWMHALNRVAAVTRDFTYNRWAMELAKTAHDRFVYAPCRGGQKRMYWKMSIDLSYPLVPSMGLHDPLDGLVTYCQLQATQAKDPGRSGPDLSSQIREMGGMCQGKNWVTDDPLGIGGLLSDAFRIAQLTAGGHFKQTDLIAALLEAALLGLASYGRDSSLSLSAEYRLAFRELGLSIGLKALERLRGLIDQDPDLFDAHSKLDVHVAGIERYGALGEAIDRFWLQPEHSEAESWKDHRHINMVMLATSQAPDGYLTI